MNNEIRYSHQRELIFNYIKSSKEHPSAEVIYSALKPFESKLSLGTVYRNLKVLEDLGKIQKITSFDNIDHYDYNCDNHAHFICKRCNRIFDVDSLEVSKIKKYCLNNLQDVYLEDVNLTLKGLCKDCK